MSTNRRVRFPGDRGDDGLGYDFRVPLRSITLFFEVKASKGSSMEIDLGESQIRFAQKNTQQKDPFRILYIPDVLDSSRRRVYILPNPFGEKGRDFFRVVGSGLRFRFQLAK